jgi:hypothetical protein
MKSTGCFGGNDGDEPGFGGKDDACRRGAWKAVLRRTLQVVAGTLDRLLPAHPLDREVELPAEWFKYPPF